MRWFWIDRFEQFVRGTRAVTIKAVAMAEEQFDDYSPGYPVMPTSLVIEGMAQTAGLLIGEMSGFEHRVVLAKIGKAVFHFPAVPGDMLRYTATILDVKTDGAMATITSHIGDRLHGEVEMMFAFLDDRFPPGPLFEPVDFVAMVRAFGMYDVGVTPDGKPIELPAFYVQAQRDAEGSYSPTPSPVVAGGN
ncbi:MAG: beta-hydroxyacyl-ACP dehydratase [Planctomycetaceae bacterium]|nr:beta-hydroxyacyl-ACP dehydratase [Planctomycetaceae bacterium]